MTEAVPAKTRNPYAPFEERIISEIIGPEIIKAIRARDDAIRSEGKPVHPPSSKSEVHAIFCKHTGSSVSSSKFGEWMDKAGIVVERQVALRVPDKIMNAADNIE